VLEVVYYVAASVDGFIATADGGVEWLSEFSGAEDYGYSRFYAGIDAAIMGRTTYEQVLTFGGWPHSDRPTWVLSHRRLPEPPAGVTVTPLAPPELVAELEKSGLRRVWLVGGGEVAGSFARAGLITEYIISVMPVSLGEGVRLLGREGAGVRLRLASSVTIGEVVQNTYRTVS
jgi:dihydrofolate reductase